MKTSQKTIRLLKAYRFSGSLMFILPVIVPYWHSLGLNQAQIGWLQTAFTAIVLIMQLPTGRLADMFGRRRLIIIGSILAAIGFSLYALATNFAGMLLAEIILGFGYSCKSGADLALLRQELENDDAVETEKNVIGQLAGFSAGGELVSAIVGGWLASATFGLPLWLTVGGISLAIPFAIGLPKDKPSRASTEPQLSMSGALRSLVASKRMVAISSFSVTAGVATHLFVWLLQPYLQQAGLEIGWFGLAWALYSASFMVLSWKMSKIEHWLGEDRSMIVALAAPVVAYLILGLGMTLWLAPIAFLFTLSRALNGPIATHLVHENTRPAQYATMLSGLAAIQGLTYAVLGPLSGWTVDTFGLRANLLFLGGLFATASLISFIQLKRHHLSIPIV